MFKTTNQNAQRRASRSRMFQSDTDRKIRNKQARQNASCAAVLALQQYEDEKTPGTLYRHFDVDGVLLYVGIAVDALSRMKGHQYASPWHRQIATVTLEHFPSRRAAIEAERTAIENENPKFNIAGK